VAFACLKEGQCCSCDPHSGKGKGKGKVFPVLT